MSRPLKVMLVFGTRPEAIKMAPIVQACRLYPEELQPVVVVTAQHRDMLDQVLHLFDLTPDHDLNIMTHGQTLAEVTVRALGGLDPILRAESPAAVLVQGDTTTTFTGALAAFYHQIPVGHVEAGLRTANRYNPFPEELNRRMTSVAADWHFAPTPQARDNLLQENVPAQDIVVTGNTVIDALLVTAQDDAGYSDPRLAALALQDRRVLLVTTHRRENLGEPLRQVYGALKDVLERFPDTEVVFAVHKNPVVQALAAAELGDHPRVHLVEPPAYRDFARLMRRADLILTDSGGVQEEAPALGKPVLVLRETTERPEGVAAGTVRLVGTERAAVAGAAMELLADEQAYRAMAAARNPYGDGQAARRIVEWLLYQFKRRSDPPLEFRRDF